MLCLDGAARPTTLYDHRANAARPEGDRYGTPMGSLWDSYGIVMGLLWDSYGTPMGLL